MSGLEARIAALEAEAEFETVSVSEVRETGSGGGYLSQSVPLAGPSAPQSLGSGGVYLSPARTSPALQEGSVQGRLASSSSLTATRRSEPPYSPGSGGGELSRVSPSAVHPDGTSTANPGPPTSQFRTAIAEDVGAWLTRALSGAFRGSSGRDRLALQSRYYIVLVNFQGQRASEPLVCSSFSGVRQHCCQGPDRGQSVFVGLPSQAEVSVALRAAGLSWPSGGLNGQPQWV